MKSSSAPLRHKVYEPVREVGYHLEQNTGEACMAEATCASMAVEFDRLVIAQ